MPIHPFEPPRGRIETIAIESEALVGNLLGDPTRRSVAVYLPEGYDDSDADYPLFVDLAGFLGSGLKHVGWQLFGDNVPQRIDRLVRSGRMGPVIAAFPDCFTSLGGNQYVNSVAMGRWEDFLLDEMIPRIESEFRVRPGAAHRAVFGKSSGGYGSLIQALRHGDRWAAAACHSGDVGFDVVYRREFPAVLDELAKHDREIPRFLEHLGQAKKISSGEMHVLMLLAMAASYDPDPQAPKGIRLPVDLYTAELDDERWSRWLAHDPLTLVERDECQKSLRKLKALHIDCGSRDQYFIHYGSRSLSRRLEALGIPHRYEEFDDDHSSVDYRMDRSLPFLYEAATGGILSS
jgi:enterochelin esterase-like enzyme